MGFIAIFQATKISVHPIHEICHSSGYSLLYGLVAMAIIISIDYSQFGYFEDNIHHNYINAYCCIDTRIGK